MAILYSTQTWEREADESSAALNLRYVICGHRPKHLIANDYENDKYKKDKFKNVPQQIRFPFVKHILTWLNHVRLHHLHWNSSFASHCNY